MKDFSTGKGRISNNYVTRKDKIFQYYFSVFSIFLSFQVTYLKNMLDPGALYCLVKRTGFYYSSIP